MCKIIFTGDSPKKEIAQIFSETIEELINDDSEVVYIDADLMSSMRSKGLWEKYPKNVINTGIQEANMIGVAAGMYLAGKKTYVHSFAPFASRRCYDQTYISIGYAGKSIRIIGSEPGLCAQDNGGTHMSFEDIALMRVIPGSTVIDVSDGHMFHELLKVTKDMNGVVYFRTPRRGLADIYSDDETFEIGKGKKIVEGKECTVVASGIMVATALQAEKLLADKGIYIEVIDPITIKPLDKDLILQSVMKTGKVIVMENHNIIGGLGSAVSELLGEEYPVPIKRIGIRDEFGQVGNIEYLRKQYKLTINDLVEEVEKILEKRV